ncbi:hypothetical protein PTTG_10160, partial [Puccinia triticina 1-1 BBBD Race 1]
MLEVIGRALAAEEAGQSVQAIMYFKICKGLGAIIPGLPTPQAPPPTTTPATPAPTSLIPGFRVTTPAPAINPRIRDHEEMLASAGLETAILFDDAAIPNNDDIGLPHFFAKNLLEFRAPLPLTIFNEWWQEQAFLHHAEKRSKSDEASGDRFRYTGFPYPSEYLQTYQEWSVNHQGFLRAVSKIPSHANLANWLVIHKRNVDGIIRREGFMTALRYDIHVRMNALCHRVPVPGGRLSVANISIFRTEIVQEVNAKTVRFGETEFTDNPYAAGGCRFGGDPTTGQQTKKKDEPANWTPLHLQQLGKQFANTIKPGPETPKGPSNQKEPGGKQGGFKGSKWGSSYDREGEDRATAGEGTEE